MEANWACLAKGINMCIFTYGQTNSGKTFTMKGPSNDPGLVLRTLEGLFTKLAPSLKCYFEITMSYFEIYNEEVYDLLDNIPNAEPLKVQVDKEKGVEIKGLTKKFIYSFSEASKCYDSGENKRKFAVTNMNHNSSRSHVLLQIGIRTKYIAHPNRSYYAVLLMADLAGSESMETAGTTGQTQREGSLINKSLLALTTIITRLKSNHKKAGPLSYRDSKLTRVLQPVLTENTNTMVICTVSRDNTYIHESMNTLRFGDCANKVKLRMRPVDVEKLSLSARDKREGVEDLDEQDEHRDEPHTESSSLDVAMLRADNDHLREALEKSHIELDHQVAMLELQEEKNQVLEQALRIKESEILRLRDDNRQMQRMMDIQEKNIVLSLEHSIKKRLLFEVRAAYESEIGRLKTELIEAIEASTVPMEDKTLKRKLKLLYEKVACGEKETRDLKSRLMNREDEVRKMREELEILKHDQDSKRFTRVVPHISGSKKPLINQIHLESSVERKLVQNSPSREASRSRHRNCCTPQSIAMIPTLRLPKQDSEPKDIQGARIFTGEGGLSRVVEQSIKKETAALSPKPWGSRSGNQFSFGAHLPQTKFFSQEPQINDTFKAPRQAEKAASPDTTKYQFFDNISRSPIKNACSTDYLESFIWRARGSVSEPHQAGSISMFTPIVPESGSKFGNPQHTEDQPEMKFFGQPHLEHTTATMSLNERIEQLKRPMH